MGDVKPIEEALLTSEQVAEVLAVDRTTLKGWRIQGCGPKFLQLTARCIRYRRSDIEAWVAKRERRSTSDPGPPEAGDGRA